MNWVLALHTLILFPSAAISLFLARFAWRRRDTPGAMPLVGMAIGVAIWTAGAGVYPYLVDRQIVDTCTGIEFGGITILLPSFLAFAIRFAGWRKPMPRLVLVAAGAISLTLTILTATNQRYHLVWTTTYRETIIYDAFIGYCYTLGIAGLSILLGRTVLLPPAYRWQGGVMIVAALIPTLVSIPFELGLLPRLSLDPTPPTFVVSITLVWWGLFRLRLLDLNPIAHSVLMENMKDGMLVVDIRNRILDVNRSALGMFQELTPKSIGQPVQDELKSWPLLEPLRKLGAAANGRLDVNCRENLINLEAHALPIMDSAGQLTGHLFLLSDITDRCRAEAEKSTLIAQLRAALGEVKTLQGLLPICAGCKNIRDEAGEWHRVEAYISHHTDTKFSHGLCPDCSRKLYPE